MKSIIINGGRPLFGTVKVSGSKNAVLPILFAALTVYGTCEIIDVPSIGDTDVALELLTSFGASYERRGNSLLINTKNVFYNTPDPLLVKKIRASTYLIGACLSRFGECNICDFGGCNFSLRPIDLHISAAEALGAQKRGDKLVAGRLRGGEITLTKPSVGATVNALIMSASADGTTHIKGYAREPHVLLLIDFLRSCGAEIELKEKEITVHGRMLRGGRVKVIGDMIEAGTYLTAGLVTGGEVKVVGVSRQSMEPYISSVSLAGGSFMLENDSITVKGGALLDHIYLKAEPYPGFPTDLQPIIAPLFAVNSGGIIEDSVFPERFGYLDVLSSFGVKSRYRKGRAEIYKSELKNAKVKAPCLRGGAACLLSALAANGKSVITSAETILRGYESPIEKLTDLGASITKI